MSGPAFSAVGVIVPARDEVTHIERCLEHLAVALTRLPATVRHSACLVLDRCSDGTDLVAAEVRARHPRLALDVVRNRRPRTVGALRDLGLRRTLRRMAGHPPAGTWLLSTDADSVVGASWATDHLRHAALGAHAVAGTVELDDPGRLGERRRQRYAELVQATVHGDRHDHVYAANFGVRADAYLAVGGFPSVPSGEEHHLCLRLRAAGYRIATPTAIEVRTSARRYGRATGGLADLLRGLPDTGGPPATGAGDHR